jgi:integrase
MPWRKDKYKNPKQGKHGPIYNVVRGVTVRKDTRDIWAVYIEKGGKRKSIDFGIGRDGLAKAIKAAETIAASLNKLVLKPTGIKKKSSRHMFSAYSKQWLEGNVKLWSTGTYQRYGEVLRLYIWPYQGFLNKTVKEIKRRDIKQFMRKLYKIRSAATVEIAHSILCGILEEAVDDSILPSNPARNLRRKVLPKVRQRKVKKADVFSYEERDLFLEQAEKICLWGEVLILKVMAFVGLRLGEALAMRAEHIDFVRMTYDVCESYKIRKFGTPKTENSFREVDLPRFLIEELKSYILHLRKEALKAGKKTEISLLFLDPKENYRWPYSQRRIQGIMKKVCKRAGLKARNPHDLRHTYATTLLRSHKSPAYVKEQLGHHSIQVTVDIYGHLFPGECRNGLEEALLGPVRNPSEKHIYKSDGL